MLHAYCPERASPEEAYTRLRQIPSARPSMGISYASAWNGGASGSATDNVLEAILGDLTRQAMEQSTSNALNGSNGSGRRAARLDGQGPWT